MAQNGPKQPRGSGLVPAERRRQIARLLQESGSVTVNMLEEEFGVSPMTARRDLSALEKQGKAARTHGGAVLPGFSRHEDSFHLRLERDVDAKHRLARAAVELLDHDETIFVDSSSTSYYAARTALGAEMRLTLLTNLVPLMNLFATVESPNVDLIGIGGSLRKLTLSFVGPRAVDSVRSHFADRCILSIKGVTPDGYLTDPDSLEAEVKREMIRHSDKPMLLIEGGKLDQKGLNVVTHVSEVSRVLVAGGEGDRVRLLSEYGCDVQRV